MEKQLLQQITMLSKWAFYGLIVNAYMAGTLGAMNIGSAQSIHSVKETIVSLKCDSARTDEVFNLIERKTDYNFSYNLKDINAEIFITRNFKKATVADILLMISEQSNLKFKQVNNTIHVAIKSKKHHDKPDLEIVIQGIEITGKVISPDDQEGLPGVNVIIKGIKKGTVTDADGHYRIIVPSEESILVFSSVGFVSKEVTVANQQVIDVVMEADVTALKEIVVIGYGTQKREEVTSSVASVQSEDFNAGGVRSPLDLIQGKVAGLNITRTQGNNPNSSADIQLRGVTSLRGTTTPLIVIDGIPGANLDLLQQDDIESIDVLKDGSAAAIYGTRGNAGVILITTKKGKAGEPRFDYSTYFQRETLDRKPNFLTANEYRNLISQGLIDANEDMGSSTDLYDQLIDKKNFSQYHNFAASGGSYNSNYRAAIYFNEANGIARENGREQFGGRLNINQSGVQDRLDLQLNLATNFNKANLLGGGGGDFEQAIQRNPTAPVYNPDGTFVETQAFNNYNPISRLVNRINERDQQTFSGDARLSYELVNGLTASAFGSYVRDSYNDRRYRSAKDWDQRPSAEYQGMGYAYKANYLNWTNTFESTIDYRTVINEHSIGAIAGYSYQYSTTETFWVENNGFTTDAFRDWNLGDGSAINNDQLPRPGMDSEKYDNTLIAFFGRVNYVYQGKYFAQAILRREGSSRFGANHKWGNFPAASVGWTLSEEAFLTNLPVLNSLKLRIGYGVTGNQGIPSYQSLVTLGTGGVYPQEGIYYQTYGAARNPNPDLRWERKGEWNFGLDYGLLNNRISGAIDVYNRLTTDLLYDYNAQQPPYVRDRIYTNVGSIRNKGVELLISAIPVRKSQFQWTTDLAANWQENELEQLSNDVFQANWLEFAPLPSPGNLGSAIRLEEGGAVGNFYGKRFAGFAEDGQWLFHKADGSTGTASEMTEGDLAVIGNGVPKYNAALTNTFRYRKIDLTIFFRGKFGFDILNTKEMYFGNQRWLPNNLLKSAITKHAEMDDNPQYSDYYLENGGFVKLDNVTLGYNFDINVSAIRKLRIYFTGRNLLTFTGYSGIDPELQNTGLQNTGVDSRGFYPRTKSWTLGLNFGF